MDCLPSDTSFQTKLVWKNYIDFILSNESLILNIYYAFYFEIVFHESSAINTPPCFKV